MTGAGMVEVGRVEDEQVEPWLRGTLCEVPALGRAVLHALELARENVDLWTPRLSDAELHAKPFGLTPYAFHVRHIAHSLDRLLNYAEGKPLDVIQRAALSVELEPGISGQALLGEFHPMMREAEGRVRALARQIYVDGLDLDAQRFVGGRRLPASLGGLLVHLADHTQRHAGQAVTTAKLLLALRSAVV
jgi:hypothetical protein